MRWQAAGQNALVDQQIGHPDHCCQREGAIADEVGRDVDFHPVGLQRRDQRLDFVRLTIEGVPQQETDRGTDHQQHEGAQLAVLVAQFVKQVEQRGEDGKQDENFIQVAERDMSDIRADQVGLVPARHQADQAHHHRAPGNGAGNPGGKLGAAQQGEPVAGGGDHEQRTHPHDGGLAAEKEFEEEGLFRPGQLSVVLADAEQAQGMQLPAPMRGKASRTSPGR